jgi:hypothetical protein
MHSLVAVWVGRVHSPVTAAVGAGRSDGSGERFITRSGGTQGAMRRPCAMRTLVRVGRVHWIAIAASAIIGGIPRHKCAFRRANGYRRWTHRAGWARRARISSFDIRRLWKRYQVSDVGLRTLQNSVQEAHGVRLPDRVGRVGHRHDGRPARAVLGCGTRSIYHVVLDGHGKLGGLAGPYGLQLARAA